MSIHIACPSCGAKLRVPDNATGKKAKCTKCSRHLVISGPTGPEEQTNADKGQVDSSITCWYCEEKRADVASSYSAPMYRIHKVVKPGMGEGTKFLLAVGLGNPNRELLNERIFYRKQVVQVPRCYKCMKAHEDAGKHRKRTVRRCCLSVLLIWCLSWVPIWSTLILSRPHPATLGDIIGTFVFFGAIYGLVIILAAVPLCRLIIKRAREQSLGAIPPEEHGKEFHKMKDLLVDNWKMGEKPNVSDATLFDITEEYERRGGRGQFHY